MKKSAKCLFFFVLMGLGISVGCKKHQNKDTLPVTDTVPVPVNPVTTATVCDYDVSDTSLTNHGWTKAFDDEFTGALDNWWVLTGGEQNELQCNEPANVQIVNGVLQITASRQTVTGPKTVGNDTTQSFDYTSGWIISKQTFSANVSTPKVRIVARIKAASGYGLTSLFYGFGTDWPTNGEIDYMGVLCYDTKMKGLEDYTFDECLDIASVANLDGILVPFLHINQLIANKKAVNRRKDQIDVEALSQKTCPPVTMFLRWSGHKTH